MAKKGLWRDAEDGAEEDAETEADALGAGLSFDEYMQVRRALGVCDHGRYLRYSEALFHGIGGTNRGSKHFPGVRCWCFCWKQSRF